MNYYNAPKRPLFLKRHLVIVALICFVVSKLEASEPCALTLKAKSPGARSATIHAVSFSAKQLNALRSVCIVKIAHLTKADKLEAYKNKLEREEAELKLMMSQGDL